MGEILAILMFVATLFGVVMGYSVAFTLAGMGLFFAGLGVLVGVYDPAMMSALGSQYLGTMLNETLVAVPLFVFMGVTLERSKIAESLLTTMGELFGCDSRRIACGLHRHCRRNGCNHGIAFIARDDTCWL
jgi:TRAP-type mannitol/chloroaromatic compound transport system permease large subunit